VIAEPPVAACVEGAVKAMLAEPLPGVATNAIGGFGVVRGVTNTLYAALSLTTAELTAFTWTVYVVPFVSEEIVNGLAVPTNVEFAQLSVEYL
jgi:hypothetical protein